MVRLLFRAGKYQLRNDTSYCDKCPAGKYQALEGAHVCFTSAQHASRTGLRIKICDVGTYLTNHNTCAKCPVGKFQDRSGQPSCALCPKGKFQSHPGEYYCWTSTLGQAKKEASTSVRESAHGSTQHTGGCCDPSTHSSRFTHCVVDRLSPDNGVRIIKSADMSRAEIFASGDRHVCKLVHGFCKCCDCKPQKHPSNIRSLGQEFFWVQPPFMYGGGHHFQTQDQRSCEYACSNLARCIAGTFVRHVHDGSGQCWLSANVSRKGAPCAHQKFWSGASCASFSKVSAPRLSATSNSIKGNM